MPFNDTDMFGLSYPPMFNYRHGLEIAMKRRVERYGPFAATHGYEVKRREELWSLYERMIVDISGLDALC